jgi:hypothetical protein
VRHASKTLAGNELMPAPAPPVSAEVELILLCSRLREDPSVDEAIRMLAAGSLDWDRVIETAHLHKVIPLLWRRLSRTVPDAMPEAAAQRLRRAFQANVKRNLFLTAELIRVLDAFAAHDIRTIPYKGPALASMVYGDISLRQFADLDLIIPESEVIKARNLLLSRGYREEAPTSDDALGKLLRTDKHITLLRDDLGVNLEIHWGITASNDPIHIPPAFLWAKLGTGVLAGRTVPVHCSEDLLLIQCIHGAKHGWERLAWICDVAELVRSRPDLKWSVAVTRAADQGALRILLLGLSLAEDLVGAQLPPSLADAIRRDAVLLRLSRQLRARLFSDTAPFDLGAREQYFMDLREHSADKLRIALHQARLYLTPTERDAESLPVPGFLSGMRYVVRPLRLAWEYGLAPFKRFVRGVFQS